MKKHFSFLIIIMALVFTACVPHEKILYFADLKDQQQGELSLPESPPYTLSHGDIVNISINSNSKETNAYLMPPQGADPGSYGSSAYRVSEAGTVELPLVGEVLLAGKTLEEAEAFLKEQLRTFVQMPVVNMRLLNFKVSVLGEVANPGLYEVSTTQLSLLDALALAGDLTLFGKRDNILIIRNSGQEKKFFRVNLNNSAALNAKEYYLHNNDVIYVEPSKGKSAGDDNLYRVVPIIVSSLTLVVVMVGLFQN